MTDSYLFNDWENEQGNSPYPFSDQASLTNGSITIARDLFIDARVHLIGGVGRHYLSEITISGSGAEVTVSDADGLSCSGFIEFESGEEVIRLADQYSRPAGVFVTRSDSLALLSTWPIGTYAFTVDQTELVVTTVIPTAQPGVRGFLLESGEFFAGDVWMFAEQGVFFTKDDAGNIRVDILGDPAIRRKSCDNLGVVESVKMVKTISGMGPNTYGDFKLVSGGNEALDTVFRVRPVDNGLKVELVGGVLQSVEN